MSIESLAQLAHFTILAMEISKDLALEVEAHLVE